MTGPTEHEPLWQRRFLHYDGFAAFAHRGGSAEAPENTHAAFAHARSLGYRFLETDVHATSDGVVAVIHDPTLDRMAGRPGLIAQLPWKEVAAAELPGGQRVPRLDELLEEWPDARWNIDAKAPDVVEPLVALLRRAGAVDRVCVTSFFDRRLGRIRALGGPQLATAMGRGGVAALRAASYLPNPSVARRGWGTAVAAQVPLRSAGVPVVDRRLVAAAHRVGVAVHVWTIDDPAEMERLVDLGVDGIMTDRPSALRDVLARRGLWLD